MRVFMQNCRCNSFEVIDITEFKRQISNYTSQILLKFQQTQSSHQFFGLLMYQTERRSISKQETKFKNSIKRLPIPDFHA